MLTSIPIKQQKPLTMGTREELRHGPVQERSEPLSGQAVVLQRQLRFRTSEQSMLCTFD